MAYSAAKVPMLFFLTLAVTLPSLYVFNALVGCRLSFTAVLRLLIAALGVTLAVLASFGTITVFFSLCTTSYPFMVLLNVLMFALVGAQMGWVLRPFVGAPDAPVAFFRAREGNFFQAVADKIADLATGRNPRHWHGTGRGSGNGR